MLTSLVLLLVMTVLAVTTMRNATLEERMAANAAFRNQAFQAAESVVVEAITSADYGAALNDSDPLGVTVTAPSAAFSVAATVRPYGSSSEIQCRPATGSSIGIGHECQPGSSEFLFEIDAGAQLMADGEVQSESQITAGVAYRP